MQSKESGEVLTGVLYVDAKAPSFIEMLNIGEEPLGTLPESRVRPSREALAEIMESLR
jgi:2-oxoglutarate ferredoxin oxidoreductase subunit beta